MGSSAEDTFKVIQKTLEPYIRPREEVTHIRQILAVHLDSCLDDETAGEPLALIDARSPCSSSTARGLQKEYLEALNANIEARNEFAACCRVQEKRTRQQPDTSTGQGADRLQEHVAAIRLRQRADKLQVIKRSFNSLGQKPAASPDFLDSEEIFRDAKPLPTVPHELVTALTVGKTTAGPHLQELIDQLEKHVLQTKLLLRREEQLLEKVKSRSVARPGNISESAKLAALERTRAELISWIETELGKAAADEGAAEGQDAQRHRPRGDSFNMEEQLGSIKEKYAQYLGARQALLQLASQRPLPVMKPPVKEAKPQDASAPRPPPTAHLLSPQLEQLLSLSHEQKGFIAEKSHLNAAISKQLKENSQVLEHLAEESHLIPAHPMPGAPGSSTAFADAVSATKISGLTNKVKPWVFAADSAKISTLEAVAEKIEEGQIALESSMRTLEEIDELLGQLPDKKQEEEQPSTGEDDLWLAEGQHAGKSAGARKHTLRKADTPAQPNTVWDTLDGKLGLLRPERDTI
ncbi:hypothetical protein N657DRAFT_560941 [Parathielavia appendiculata]|uniref:Uncharacterized protein n=1 Tax=Parathielavia appendiculata TaxID=2587402 RepID=A0AAN6U8L1_9PEZI|nr:hypothetical protein N657DRAFT_560941 [Parathielavia appendiculata]